MTRLEEIEKRKAEIREEVEATEEISKVEELNEEVEALQEEEKEINEQEVVQKEAEELEEKKLNAKEIIKEERKIMNEDKLKELRSSKEYVDAFAKYIKTEDISELRALITTGGYATGNSATVEVPTIVDEFVRTAWEREDLMNRVRTLSAKGNLKVQFEVSGDAAVEHTEGQSAVDEESLVLGVVSLAPVSIKKWISLSDEVLDMKSEEFLRYIYDEITYRIAKKCADKLVGIIKSLPTSLSANGEGVYDSVSANKITAAPSQGLVANALSQLSDEANRPVIIMNKATWGKFKEIQYNGNFNADPFEGLDVIYNNSLPAYDSATANAVYMIVGDLNVGALVNFPAGEGIETKYDDTTLMTQDLVRILGRRYVGMNAVSDKAFVNIAKPSTSA